MGDQELTRREFIARTGGLAIAAGSLGSGAILCSTPTENQPATTVLDLSLPAYAALNTPGSGIKTDIPGQGDPVIVTRISDTQAAAFSAVCTHQGCIVNAPQAGEVVCPCHGSKYSLAGAVTQGPAAKNLRSFSATVEGSTIVVKT